MLSFTVDLADCLQLNVLDVISTFVSSLFYLHCGGPEKNYSRLYSLCILARPYLFLLFLVVIP